jgi:hypothetical protein
MGRYPGIAGKSSSIVIEKVYVLVDFFVNLFDFIGFLEN